MLSARHAKNTLLPSFFLVSIALFMILFIRVSNPQEVQAASSYKSLAEIVPSDVNPNIQQYGAFWFKNSGGYLYYGPSAYETNSYAGHVYDSWTNGSMILNISYDGALQQINCKTGITKKLKQLPGYQQAGEGDSWNISAIYGKRVYLTRGSFNKWKQWTYLYKLNSGSFKKVKANCAIRTSGGKYMVGEKQYHTDVSAVQQDLYKSTKSGLKKIKRLAKWGLNTQIVGKKIYYISYTDKYMTKGTLYRCNLDGSRRKKLGSFKITQQYGQLIAREFTSQYCTIYKDGQSYRYTYKTKSLTPM